MPGTFGRSGGDRKSNIDLTLEDGAPEMPKSLSADSARKWKELLSQLPPHSLRKVDVHQLGILCELLAISDRMATRMDADQDDHKARRLYVQVAQQICRMSALFGLSPADRARLHIEPPEDPDSPMAQWLKLKEGRN